MTTEHIEPEHIEPEQIAPDGYAVHLRLIREWPDLLADGTRREPATQTGGERGRQR